jgi:methyl-accepting chemotaxis protein
MFLKKLKVTGKLILSAAAFCVPLGIMLFLIISFSYNSVQKENRELHGIETLRPAVSLMQIVPNCINFKLDNKNIDEEKNRVLYLIYELMQKYSFYFNVEKASVLQNNFLENWETITSNSRRETILLTYRQLMLDLYSLIFDIGDESGLIADSEIESSHLVIAVTDDMPQIHERLVNINISLYGAANGGFNEKNKSELELHLGTLIHSDSLRLKNRINFSAETGESVSFFENYLKSYNSILEHLSGEAYFIISRQQTDSYYFTQLNGNIISTINAIYRLHNAALDRLETLSGLQIKRHNRHLLQSLIISIAAMAGAFTIILITAKGIHNSVKSAVHIFKKFETNDFTADFSGFSNDEIGDFMRGFSEFHNKLINAFSSFNENAALVSTAVYDLSTSAREITTTANEQSASVAEIVSTMENNKNLSEQMAVNSLEVAQLASNTQDLSQRGVELRDAGEDMMLDIRDQNLRITESINNLTEMLLRIGESVQLIDSIADQTKLIAFNAALEASSSGEAGMRFAVVAGEIRRFADNVVESSSEIKEKISELQDAFQALISEAGSGTRAIEAGYSRMVEQKEVFENIVNVSHDVASRSSEISSLSRQQELASAQIFTALKEISAGVKQFVSATAFTSSTADKLNSMSAELKETLANYQTGNFKKGGNE